VNEHRNIRSRATGSLLPVFFVLNVFLAFGQTLRAAEVIPPRPTGTYLNDYARVLSSSTVTDLNRQLADFEKQSSNQVLVVIYNKMQSDSDINDYAVRVAQAWGVGRKDRKNGVVLFIFIQDRKMSIQVGYGLEGALTDALSKDIISDEIAPRFRNNDYDGGVRAGVDAIMKATRGEYKGSGRTLGAAKAQRRAWIGPVIITIGIWIFAAWLRRRVRSAVYGGQGAYYRRGFGGGFWPGYFIGSGFGRGGGGGSWGGGGGGSWGGGGGGGGFSAGGGGFGGGGASGSW